MMIHEIAQRLVELCRAGQFEQAQTELFDEDAVSIEPPGSEVEIVEGLQGIREKGHQFMSGIEEVHGIEVSDPIIAGAHFSVALTLDSTMKGRGRHRMEEICVYEVHQGKIVTEQFFYDMG